MKENENREQAILRAAEREFLARGYDGTKTTAIAEAAGVTHHCVVPAASTFVLSKLIQ